MYRDFSRYIATDKDRQAFRQWMLGCAIVYGLPLLYLIGIAAFTDHTDVSPRGAAPSAIADVTGPRPAVHF